MRRTPVRVMNCKAYYEAVSNESLENVKDGLRDMGGVVELTVEVGSARRRVIVHHKAIDRTLEVKSEVLSVFRR